MPDSFNNLITALETFLDDDESKLTCDYIRNALLSDEDKPKYKELDQHGVSNEDALIASQKRSTVVGAIKCERCGKAGHSAAKCYSTLQGKTNKSSRFPGNCHSCRKTGHKARDCVKGQSKGKTEKTYINTAMKVGPKSQSVWWCVDSGASQHMSSVRNKKTDFKQFNRPVKIFMGDKSMLL